MRAGAHEVERPLPLPLEHGGPCPDCDDGVISVPDALLDGEFLDECPTCHGKRWCVECEAEFPVHQTRERGGRFLCLRCLDQRWGYCERHGDIDRPEDVELWDESAVSPGYEVEERPRRIG